jgi:hypothetical protein
MNKFLLIISICFACISLCLAESSLQNSKYNLNKNFMILYINYNFFFIFKLDVKLPVIIADLAELLVDAVVVVGFAAMIVLEVGYVGFILWLLFLALKCLFTGNCSNGFSINFTF